jgi:c-di-GMP-binding flagellar brake protein YcgR
MQSERRIFERYSTKILAEVYDADNLKKIGKANIFNVSIGGVGIESNFVLNEREKLVLKFHLKKYKYDFSRLIVGGEVEVRWTSLKGDRKYYGVKFLKMSSGDRRRIREYIAYIKSKKRKGADDEEKKL